MSSPIHFEEKLRVAPRDQRTMGKALEIVRERQERYGEVIIPDRRVICPDCERAHDIVTMPRFRTSGIVSPVVDILCKDCGDKEWRKKGFRYPRLVCVGCKEVVQIYDVSKEEPHGFLWSKNTFYHVQECPRCARRAIRSSQIIEKLVFYKQRGIPYE